MADKDSLLVQRYLGIIGRYQRLKDVFAIQDSRQRDFRTFVSLSITTWQHDGMAFEENNHSSHFSQATLVGSSLQDSASGILRRTSTRDTYRLDRRKLLRTSYESRTSNVMHARTRITRRLSKNSHGVLDRLVLLRTWAVEDFGIPAHGVCWYTDFLVVRRERAKETAGQVIVEELEKMHLRLCEV